MQLFSKKTTLPNQNGQATRSTVGNKNSELGIESENITQLRPKTKSSNMVDATRQSAVNDLVVAVGHDGLPESLQTAALLFANNEMAMATDVLLYALDSEPESSTSACWLALMDLYVKQGQRQKFDELALRYVVAFERSAPAWDELKGRPQAKAYTEHHHSAITFPAECLGKHLAVIDELTALYHKKLEPNSVTTVNLEQLAQLDAETSEVLTKLLQQLRRKGINLEWQGLLHGLKIVRRPLNVRAQKHQELWLFALELLQWQNNQTEFENLAIDYAVCFSISPPSWEPLNMSQAGQVGNSLNKLVQEPLVTDDQQLIWQGKLSGPSDLQVAKLHRLKQVKNTSINIKDVVSIDFVCAGDISNAFLKVMASGTIVSIIGASPIIQALLQLTGTPQSLFFKTIKS